MTRACAIVGWDSGNMAAALENELEVDNEDYYSLLNVGREVRMRRCFKRRAVSHVRSYMSEHRLHWIHSY